MKRYLLSVIGVAGLVAPILNARAVTISVQLLSPTQVTTTAWFRGGLLATGSTDFYTISVAAGFTVTCEYNSLSINAESGSTLTDYFRPPGPLYLTVPVPVPAPGSYQTANWGAVAEGECKVCNFAWKGTATGESVGFSGHGASVSFSTGSETRSNTVTFQMCKPGTEECSQ
jgi:hypothetical protein